MNGSTQLLVIMAGLFFTAWPIAMNRSSLSGYLAASCFSGFCFILTLPLAAWQSGLHLPSANWKMAALAGICGACGLLLFNTALSRTAERDAASAVVLVNLAQVGGAAAYQAWQTGRLTANQIGGYIAAAIATLLLTRR